MFFAWRSPLANREPAGETFVPQIRELSGSGNYSPPAFLTRMHTFWHFHVVQACSRGITFGGDCEALFGQRRLSWLSLFCR